MENKKKKFNLPMGAFVLATAIPMVLIPIKLTNASSLIEDDYRLLSEELQASDFEQISVLQELDDFIIMQLESTTAKDFTPKCASCFTTKTTELSSTTYRQRELVRLGTSSVWSTATNSLRPEISIEVKKSYSISVSLNNGSETVSIGTSLSLDKAQIYTAYPSARGYKVGIGIYGNTVKCAKVRIDYYANATGKFSHSETYSVLSVTGPYVGEVQIKG